MANLTSAIVPTSSGEIDVFIDPLDLPIEKYGDYRHSVSHAMTSWLCFLTDSPLSASRNLKPSRVILAFRRQLMTGDLVVLVNEFALLCDMLLEELQLSHSEERPSTGSFIQGFKSTPVFKEYLEFRNERNSNVLKFLTSFLTFGKRVNFVPSSVNDNAYKAWLEIETDIEQVVLPTLTIANMKVLLSRHFSCLDRDVPFLPKHGSGSVSERGVRGIGAKNKAFQFNALINRLLVREGRGLIQRRVLPGSR